MTLNDMIAEMQNHGFEDLDTATLTRLLNDAYEDVWSREPWPFREGQVDITVSQGVAQVTAPADFGKVASLFVKDMGTNLEPMRREDIGKQFPGNLTEQDQPVWYYFIGSGLYLYPVPDTTYTLTLYYLKQFTPLVNPTDVPALPSNHRIIVLGALTSAYDMEDDNDVALRFQSRFEDRIAAVREEWWMQQYDRPQTQTDLYMYDDFYFFE